MREKYNDWKKLLFLLFIMLILYDWNKVADTWYPLIN